MNKADFVSGIPVRSVDGSQVMTLGGTANDWVCTWVENGERKMASFRPEDLEPVDRLSSVK
jgi:uncharacterized protein YodC (DUF2158 family)